jgi:hypothetical protein
VACAASVLARSISLVPLGGAVHLSAWPLNFAVRFSTADNMAEAISLTFLAPTRNTWAPS